MSDLATRLRELEEKVGNPGGLSDNGLKAAFLTALSEGKTVPQAAKQTGRTGTWFRRRRNPDSIHYDADFARRYDEIMAPGGENRTAIIEDVFSAMLQSAKDGNVRAQEKILTTLSEEWSWMRPMVAQGDWNIDKLQVYLPNVSTETLLTMREELLKARQAELPVIDA